MNTNTNTNTGSGDQINVYGEHNVGKTVTEATSALSREIDLLLLLIERAAADRQLMSDELVDIRETLMNTPREKGHAATLRITLSALRSIASNAAGSALADSILNATGRVLRLI